MNEHMKTSNLVSRLQAKYSALQKAVGESIYDIPPVTVDRYQLILPSPADNVGEIITFSGSPPTAFICLFVCSSRQMLLSRYLMNSLSDLGETCREYSPAPAVNQIRFWRLNVKGHIRMFDCFPLILTCD